LSIAAEWTPQTLTTSYSREGREKAINKNLGVKLLLIAALAVLFVCLVSPDAFGATENPNVDRLVLAAETAQYKTHIIITSRTGGTVSFSDQFFNRTDTIAANGQLEYVINECPTADKDCVASLQKSGFKSISFGVNTIKLATFSVPADAETTSYVISRNAEGVYTSFPVAALIPGAFAGAVPTQLVTAESGNGLGTYIVFINESAKAQAVVETLTVFDSAGKQLALESADVPPGVSLYSLKTTVPIGRVQLEQGIPGIGCGDGCGQTDEPVYVFATVNTAAGGAPRTLYLQPVLPHAVP
jgi:hypothetical protein